MHSDFVTVAGSTYRLFDIGGVVAIVGSGPDLHRLGSSPTHGRSIAPSRCQDEPTKTDRRYSKRSLPRRLTKTPQPWLPVLPGRGSRRAL